MDESQSPDELRRPRLPADHPVRYRMRGAGRESIELGQMENISESGLRLLVSTEYELDDVLELEIAVEGELIPARGRVVRVDPTDDGRWTVGLRWLGIATESLYALLYNR